jgi:hypothetical protein
MIIETPLPSKRLLAYLEKNAHLIDRIGYLSGFCDDQGRECNKYDVLIAEEYHRVDGGGHRCIIERNAEHLIAMLKQLEPCPGDDHDCFGK